MQKLLFGIVCDENSYLFPYTLSDGRDKYIDEQKADNHFFACRDIIAPPKV